jgi:hypothetical protein
MGEKMFELAMFNETQLSPDGNDGITDFLDSALKFVVRCVQALGPAANRHRIAHRDVASGEGVPDGSTPIT